MKQILLFLLSILHFAAFGQETVQFSRDKNYERLTISKDDLAKLIKSLRYYHNENRPDSIQLGRIHSISCKIGRNNESQTFTGFSQLEKIDLDGKDYTDLDIAYSDQHQPISSVYIKFSSYDRRLSIDGTDQQKVNSLFRELDEQLTAKEDFFSFINWHASLSTIFFVIFMFAQLIYFQIKPQDNNPSSLRLVRTIKFICIIYSITWVLFLLSPIKLSNFFSDFTLTADPSHWWDKYGNFIGVFSFLGATAFGIIKFLGKIFISTNSPQIQNEATEVQSDSFDSSNPQ
ncbi:hypothetical protein [Pedobacter nototheniae]|uniref:hypothetical protein n=1 Tax=Pedobacter nototheniae TaxID=2488994 RepID=UPI00104057C2|nr:hypothetical protein [Pedobacter nototheniae]